MNKDIETLLSGLADFSFTRFITTKVIKILYIVAIIFAALTALATIVNGFSHGFLYGLGALVMSILGFILTVIWARVGLELVIVIFRIAENTRTVAHAASGSSHGEEK